MPTPTPSPTWTNKALWCVGLGLLANAAALVYTHSPYPAFLNQPAFGQANPNAMLGARGIYMMPAQLGPTAFGVYLMDVDSSTICVYRTLPDTSRLKFMAARSFKYDRFMEDLNNDPPTPKEIQKLIQKQRDRVDEENRTKEPTVDQPASAPAATTTAPATQP